MATDIVIPAVGESITEGVIAAWLKSDGDYVERDEPVLELETDKITVEVPAPAAGVVHPSKGEGDTVEVGAVVGSIDESADAPSGGEKEQAEPETKEEKPAKAEAGGKGEKGGGKTATKEKPAPEKKDMPAMHGAGSGREPSTNGPAGTENGARMTPLARKLAEENQIDPSSLSGTGPGGRIREQDVLAAMQNRKGGGGAPAEPAAQAAPAAAPSGEREITRQKMTPLRQRVAQRLVEAQQTAAMLTTFNECDMTAVMDLRSKHKEAFQEAHGVKLGFMSFFVKAAVAALKAYPRVNGQIAEGKDGPEIVQHNYMDIAIAVSSPKGLVVPVVRDCQRKGFAEIEKKVLDLGQRARDGKLTLEEMQGGTFTITNGGIFGSMLSTPILNPPQSAILGMHNIVRRPVEHPQGSGEIAVRPIMYIAMSYDHRLIDGAEAVSALRTIKESIEEPDRMLLGV